MAGKRIFFFIYGIFSRFVGNPGYTWVSTTGNRVNAMGIRIGVLALQGAVSEHIDAFRLALETMSLSEHSSVVPVRCADEIPCLNGLAIGLEPEVVAGEVVEDVGAEPVGQPGRVNDEGDGGAGRRRAANRGEEVVPLVVSHRPWSRV